MCDFPSNDTMPQNFASGRTSCPAFGTRVQVNRRLEAWYVTAHHEQRKPSPYSNGLTLTTHDGPLQHRWNPKGDQWDHRDAPPGIPVDPAPDTKPERGTHRHLRRVECSVEGVVVGRTWRTEGRYVRGSTSGNVWGDGAEYDPPYLTESRRVEVVQVALDPGDDVGERRYAADVIDAMPCDVTATEQPLPDSQETTP